MISEQRWNRFMNSLRKAGRNHLAESFQSGCNDGDLIMVEREIERPVDGSLRELLRLTKGAQFDRAGAWDVYHLIPPEAPLDLASAMEAIRDSNRCFNRGDYPLLAALDGVVVVQAPDESIVRCEPGGGREDMFDNIGTLLETMTQLHEKGIFVLKPDETIDYDFEAYCKLSADLALGSAEPNLLPGADHPAIAIGDRASFEPEGAERRVRRSSPERGRQRRLLLFPFRRRR